jgi:hypothetical protein
MPVHPAAGHLSPYEPAPNAVVIEPEKGPWKNNVNWGNTFKGPLPSAAGVEIPVFDGSKIVGPPRVQTIQLFRDDNRLGSNGDYRAHIYYGVGAAQNEFFCDWSQGAQISLVANWVRVNAQSYAPLGYIPYASTGGIVQIGAAITEGTVAKGRPATFTEPTELVDDNSTSSILDAPDFARGVRVAIRNPLNTNPPLPATPTNLDLFLSSASGTLEQLDTGLTYPDGVTLLGSAVEAQVLNHSGVLYEVTVQWILSV